jgi:membrane-associated phospholipid phosphatase
MTPEITATGRLRPVDVLVAGYNAVLAGVWLSQAAPPAVTLGGLHLVLATLPLLLRRHEPAAMPLPLRALREVYPLLLLGFFWTELGWLFAARRPAFHDEMIAGIDLAWFGQHLNLTWMPAMPSLWFSELMHFLYFSYYVAAFLPPVYLAAFGSRPAAADGTLRLLATYLSCFLWYLVFPVVGPAELSPHYEGTLTEGFFYGVTHGARAAGDSLGTAFPSSHVAGVVTAAIIGWKWLARPVAWLLIVVSVGVMGSAVYTQNHYAIDVVAGLVWAVVLQLVVIPLVARWAAVRRR